MPRSLGSFHEKKRGNLLFLLFLCLSKRPKLSGSLLLIIANLYFGLDLCTSIPSSDSCSGAGRGSFSRIHTYRFDASLALKLLHVVQESSHLFRCFPVCASWRVVRWERRRSFCQTSCTESFAQCKLSLVLELHNSRSRKDPARIGWINQNADAMFQVMTSKLAIYCEITRLGVGQPRPCTCTILATLLDCERLSTGESFALGSITGQQTLKLLALKLRRRAAPAPKGELSTFKKQRVRGSELLIGLIAR